MNIGNRFAVLTLPLVLASLAFPALAAGPIDSAADAAASEAGRPVATPAATLAGGVVSVKDFDVYVDLPTGFSFVKAPAGWTFVRKLDASQLKSLPPSTLTALAVDGLDGSQIGRRYAQVETQAARL